MGLIDQIWTILNTNEKVTISNLTTMLLAMENIVQPKMVNANTQSGEIKDFGHITNDRYAFTSELEIKKVSCHF